MVKRQIKFNGLSGENIKMNTSIPSIQLGKVETFYFSTDTEYIKDKI